MTAKKQRNFRLSDAAIELLRRMREELGADETSLVEMAIRRMAKQEGIEISAKPAESKKNEGA